MNEQAGKLLIEEPPLQVLPTLARKIGLNEAIFLQQLHFWLRNSPHEIDGKKWVYNTHEEWAKQFSFWSIHTLRRTIEYLEKCGLVISTTKYNQSKVNRTKWYSINYNLLSRMANLPVQVSNLDSPSVQNGQMDVSNLDSSNNNIDYTEEKHTEDILASASKNIKPESSSLSLEILKEEEARMKSISNIENRVKEESALSRMRRAREEQLHPEGKVVKGDFGRVNGVYEVAKVFTEEMNRKYPQIELAAWGGKERGQAKQLFKLAKGDPDKVRKLIAYIIEKWDEICEKWKWDGYPNIGAILICGSKYFPEAMGYKSGKRKLNYYD